MPFNRPIPESKQPSQNTGGTQSNSSGIQTLVQAEKLTQIAVLLPSAAFIGWLAGAWLDSKLHQSWIGLAGIIFGGISGLVYVIRLVMASGDGIASGSTGSGGKDAGKGSSAGKP
jgi:ATP synthase protein I